MEDHPSPSSSSSDNPRVKPVIGEAQRIQRPAAAAPQQVPESPTLSVGDIYYTLFRHKWKIVICSVVGVVAALVFHLLAPNTYQSEARLFIRYIMDSQGVGPGGDNVKTPDQRGETIINSEIEILTSLDLAVQVAKEIGPEKILQKTDGVSDLNNAAVVIQRSTLVEVARGSTVIHITFAHRNPAIVQQVLSEIVERYLARHLEIHRSSGMAGGFLEAETDKLRSRLAQTEDELRKARNKAGVISLADSKKSNSEEIAKLKQEIFATQVEVAEHSSLLQSLTRQAPASIAGDGPSSTDTSPEPTPDQVKQYRSLLIRQAALQKKEQDLLGYVKEDNFRVKDLQTQLNELDSLRKNLEDSVPKLLKTIIPVTSQGTGSIAGTIDPASESARVASLQAKVKVLNAQLESVKAEEDKTDQMEVTILQLMRQKELEEANYKNYSESLEKNRINDAMGNGTVSNISKIQAPTPPYADKKKSQQIMVGLAIAGFFGGLAWAFLVEFYIDRSVRRPIDVERMLRLPLFLSIPKLTSKELKQSTESNLPKLGAPANAKPGTDLVPSRQHQLGSLETEPALYPFHETLRDRLIGYFENKGLTHKPKLVAVTGIGHHAGVTTTAAGLASSLSETGDGNVLLVDMTSGQGSAQQFYQGKAVCGLEEILDTRANAQIEGNLYVVGQEPGGEKLSRILPHRFNKLVPKLKASNFDYIIFDMPPVSQTSITPRLAGVMDMVLLVIESEKTDRDLVQRATALLAESKAHVGAVLNKTKTYVPLKLHQENLGNG